MAPGASGLRDWTPASFCSSACIKLFILITLYSLASMRACSEKGEHDLPGQSVKCQLEFLICELGMSDLYVPLSG